MADATEVHIGAESSCGPGLGQPLGCLLEWFEWKEDQWHLFSGRFDDLCSGRQI